MFAQIIFVSTRIIRMIKIADKKGQTQGCPYIMNTKEAQEGLIYLYCITDKVPKLSRPVIEMKAGSRPLLDGMAGKEAEDSVDSLYFIYHRGLFAVVSKVKESEFDEENLKRNLTDLEWIKVRVNIHEKVIEGIMKNTCLPDRQACVIPFKFATLFNTEGNLKTMLGAHLEEFKNILKKLEYKEEWGVKVYCNSEKLRENLTREDEQLLNIDKEINGSTTPTIDPERPSTLPGISPELVEGRSRRVNPIGPGKIYLLKKKKEELLNIAANKERNKYAQHSFERLSRYGAEARINKLLPKEATERKDDMILNSAFLVDKNKVTDFLTMVEGLKAVFVDRGFFFDCTGPWPPYNFVTAETQK